MTQKIGKEVTREGSKKEDLIRVLKKMIITEIYK
jgi:hypothetical protein